MRTFDDELRASLKQHKLVLERRRFAEQVALSDMFLVEHDENVAALTREHLIRFSCDLFCREARHVEELPSFSFPNDWWQALKERWFPRWALRRWPVKYRTVGGGRAEIDVHALFPELRPERGMRNMRIYYRPGDLRVIR